ncbi:MAG: nuclease, partial [Pyrinomonadaceae bacterium]|nr:nuclease [Pyrinomonadaceae bacterium]
NVSAKPIPISEVQGEKQLSPFNGKIVTVRGIVTARVKNGFYIQTPDAEVDQNSKTSEAVLVFTSKEPKAEATVGNLVEVTGLVDEYRPKNEPVTLALTEIKATKATDKIEVISEKNPLPKPIVLTTADLNPRNSLDYLERYESMRVEIASLTVTAPTNGKVDEKNATAVSDGIFFGVLTDTPRPFRENGIDQFDAIKLKTPKEIPLFDGNPELLRINSTAQLGAEAIDVPTTAVIKNLVGVMSYEFRAWTLFVDVNATPKIEGGMKQTSVAAPRDREFTVASFNVERFFDDQDDAGKDDAILTKTAFQNRLNKASIAVRNNLKTPDVLCVIEVENLETLKRLAEKINADAAKDGKANLKYEAYLFEGNDIGGIDTGFLVNSTKIKVVDAKQLGKDDMFKSPKDNKDKNLFDRTPIVLQATINDPKTNQPFAFTVIGLHLKSLRGNNDADKDGDFVRMKRKLEAEYVANFMQSRQTSNPNEKMILVGDFNAFQFNDGIVDVVGTISGKPTAKEKVMVASEDLVNPDLVDLVNFIPANQRYSYSFAGNAQILDHFLVTQNFVRHAARFGYARMNADFPETYRSDANRAERLSDHDAAIGYFSFDEVQPAAPTVK